MHDTIVLQGRQIGALELQAIRDLLTSHPSWNRTRLSRELCGQWGWHNEAGRLKDMACRTLLLKLEARGLLQLPPRCGMSVNGRRNLQPTAVPTDNTRFLILPWVRVPHLATHVLGLVARRLSRDWQGRYGHPIHLLEPERSGDSLAAGLPVRATAGRQTFVERERFTGTCYRAAGWIPVGDTAGRGRNAPRSALPIPPKAVFLKVLDADFRRLLRS